MRMVVDVMVDDEASVPPRAARCPEGPEGLPQRSNPPLSPLRFESKPTALYILIHLLFAHFLGLISGFMIAAKEGQILKRANPNTIQDKFLVGYQGWFTCAGDGPPVHNGHHGWLHWFNKPIPQGGRPTFDSWPDVSAYTPSELFPVPWLSLPSGAPAQLFSSRHPLTVQRHFNWMAQHGVDGAFLQRFAGQCEVDGRNEGTNADLMRLRDEVGRRVREAAEKEGRVWAVMYDVSGVPGDRIEKVIKFDWAHLVNDEKVLESSNYLKEDGRPVIALWGFGFKGRGHSPDLVRRIVRHIRSVTPGGAYIMAGAPTHWQTLKGDADPNPDFLPVWYNEFDAISPWTVGRYHNEETADRFAREKIAKDIQAIKENSCDGGRKVDYIPVVFPGASGLNLSQGKWALNEQPRDGGRFLWRQVYNARKAGVKILYGAMWDEYDEGTAFLPIVSKKRELPSTGTFLALDADGYDLPPDWYMRIAGFIGEILRSERPLHEPFPVKDLQDYWSSHPKYEPAPLPLPSSSSTAGPSGNRAGDAGEGSQSFDEWCAAEKEVEDVPPPPYSLEAGAVDATVDGSQTGGSARVQGPQQPSIPVQAGPVSPSGALPSGEGLGSSGNGHGQGQRPPVPMESRPASSWPRPSPSPAPAPRLSPRPSTSAGSSPSPSSVATPLPYHPQAHSHAQHAHIQPLEPNWSTRPYSHHNQQQNLVQGSDPAGMAELNERFKVQTLGVDGYNQSTNPNSNPMGSHGPGPSHPSLQGEGEGAQWPPLEWGMRPPSQIPAVNPGSGPGLGSRPPPPPQHPASASRPPPTPLPQGRYGSGSSSPLFPGSSDSGSGLGAGTGARYDRPSFSTSNTPNAYAPGYVGPVLPGSSMPTSGPSMPFPGADGSSSSSWYSGGTGAGGFPQPSASPQPHPQTQTQTQSTYTGSDQDGAQGFGMPMPGGSGEGYGYGSGYASGYGYGYGNNEQAMQGAGAGEYYTGYPDPYSSVFGSNSNPGNGGHHGMEPPQIPPRPPNLSAPTSSTTAHMPAPSTSPAPAPGPQFMRGSAYTRTIGAVDRYAGKSARKTVEGGIESLSTASTKMYSMFGSRKPVR